MTSSYKGSIPDFDSGSEGSNPSEVATPELYLVAHKLRGAPTFDIAIQMDMDGEVWWILPSTGHRAYPYWFENLMEITTARMDYGCCALDYIPSMPSDLPDFYPRNEPILDAKTQTAVGQSLLQTLGLGKPTSHPSVQGKIERRI